MAWAGSPCHGGADRIAMSTLVSAIIPTYNRAELLVRALESVIAQTYRPIEVVLVDDGSTDHTPQVAEEYRRKLPEHGIDFIFHRQKNGRAARARNAAMSMAHGSIFALLDSDDLWRPGFVAAMVRLLNRYSTAGLAFCGGLVIDDDDHAYKVRDDGLNGDSSEGLLRKPFEQILRHMPMITAGIAFRRSVVEDVGSFDPEFIVGEDWDLWYRISKKFDFAYTREKLACNRCHPDNMPKYDATALSSNVRVNLKHLPDVKDPEVREMLRKRIHRQFTLLQEELLRNGKVGNGHSALLAHEMAPKSARFLLGSMVADGPRWVGQSYGWMLRALGELRRGVS